MTIHNTWPDLPKIARIADFKERKGKASFPGRNSRAIAFRVSEGKSTELRLVKKPNV